MIPQQPAGTSASLRIILRLDPSAPGEPDDIEQICDILRGAGAGDARYPGLAVPKPGWRGGGDQVPDVVATINRSAPLLGQVISALRRWLAARRNPRRSVEMTIGDHSIKLDGLSRENEDRLIGLFINQVCGKP
jgi:hypothetical protein